MTSNTLSTLFEDEKMLELHVHLYSEQARTIRDEITNKLDEATQLQAYIKQLQGDEAMFQSLIMQLRNFGKHSDSKPVQHPTPARRMPASQSVSPNVGYDPKWSLVKKAVYVLDKYGNGKEMLTKEICDHLSVEEPGIVAHHGSMDKLQKNLGSSLLQKIILKVIFYRYELPKPDGQKQTKYAYGLLKWKQE